MPKILNYSESDFPSLDPSSRKNISISKAADIVTLKQITAESELIQRSTGKHVFTTSSSSTVRNTCYKVVKPYKHTETYCINIRDAITKTLNQQVAKCKSTAGKRNARNENLAGNPLDADNPVRRKGKFGLHRPKRVSKTKKNVLQARESALEAKKLAKDVVVENERILYSGGSELRNEDLWSRVYSSKLAELRKTLKCLRNIETADPSSVDEDKKRTSDFADTEYTNIIDIREAVKSSSIPAYMLLIHSHNFKRYCDNRITSNLNKATRALVSQIVRFQQNKYQRNPMKAVADKRFVLGLKQTMKYTRMNKTKLIICVPDMEDSMFNLVEELKSLASAYCIPYLFALTRRKLGFLAYKKVGVCCFGLLDYSSAEDNFNRVMEAAVIAKQAYLKECSSAKEYCQLHLGFSWPEDEKQLKADDADVKILAAEIQEKLLLNKLNNDES